MADRKSITLGKTGHSNGRIGPVTEAEREANRQRLATIIALNKPAIEAPPGINNLQEAGLDARPPDKEIDDMPRGIKAPSKSLFLQAETGVKAPPPISPIQSKYVELELAILDVPLVGREAAEWMRFLFAEKKLAGAARQHMQKRDKHWRADGHGVEMQVVPNGGEETRWLYVRRVTVRPDKGGDNGETSGMA